MTPSGGRTVSREIRLASRPSGWPVPENFELVEVELPGMIAEMGPLAPGGPDRAP